MNITELKAEIKLTENKLKRYKKYRSLARFYALKLTRLEGKLEKLVASMRQPADKMIYSMTVVCYALRLNKELIQCISKSGKDAIVQLIDGSTLSLTRYNAIKAMGEMRKQRSNGLTATQNIDDAKLYTVRNNGKDSTYQVKLSSKYLTCECQDYDNLSNKFDTLKVACKHIYKVLGTLGYGTLTEYVSHQQKLKTGLGMTPERDYPKVDSQSAVSYEASYSCYE